MSSSSIRITWIPPPEEEQNGVIKSYHINVSDAERNGEILQFETDGLTTIYIVNSLHPYYIYSIYIAASTVGRGPSATTEERTQPDG